MVCVMVKSFCLICVLLSRHTPFSISHVIYFLFICRLERLLEKAKSVLDYFSPYLGRIEIMGSSKRIERVYFEIKQSHIDQWLKPQIKVKMFT